MSLESLGPESGARLDNDARDFLRSHAHTPLCEELLASDIRFVISTNHESVLQIARSCMESLPTSNVVTDRVSLRVWIDSTRHSRPPRPKPYFRGLDHLIFMGLDEHSSFLLDLRTHQVQARLTPEIASDARLWKTILFPVLLSTLGGAYGRPVVHCACVSWKGRGVLLAGESGSGKSTLSLALARSGFEFVSDDRTLLSLREGRLRAAGLGPCLKLRPEALIHFPDIGHRRASDTPDQESAIYLDPAEDCSVARAHSCEPEAIVWLEKKAEPAFSLDPTPSGEVALRLESELARESPEAMQRQGEVFESLAGQECFRLRHGGNPHEIGRAMLDFFADRLERSPTTAHAAPRRTCRQAALRSDPLRRFTPTPLSADFRVMRRHIRVESNCPMVLEFTRRALDRAGSATSTLPDFIWRIISDRRSGLVPPWPEMNAFSDRYRRYINLGQRSFIAVDLSCREAVAFISEGLVKNEVGFSSIVLASLFYLCAGALGLTAISSACIASDGKGLLLFGVPRSGKTTSCFLARAQGYGFHADQAAFLEMEEGGLQAWGDFWPAAFHAEAADHLPELCGLGRPFVHRTASYLCAEKGPAPNAIASSIVPVACLFLEREASDSPKLVPLIERDFARMLDQCVPFSEDVGPKEARQAVRRALLKLPAFRLLYDSRPSTLSLFFHSMLSAHHVVECLG